MGIRHALVYAQEAEVAAVQAAARSLGLSAHLRPFVADDLMRLKDPVLAVIDPDLCEGFTTITLEQLRKAPRSAVTRSPVVVVLGPDEDPRPWRNAGAVVLRRRSGRRRAEKTLREAMTGLQRWIVSRTYIGPCRRSHKALLTFARRRRSDGKAKAAALVAAAPTPHTSTAAVDVGRPAATIVRQLRCAGLEFGCASPTRRAEFLEMLEELELVAQASRRQPLAKAAAAMKMHLKRAGMSGRLDDDEFENHLAAISFALQAPD